MKDKIENFGTKEWFQGYFKSITDYATRPGQLTQDECEEIWNNLSKYDAKFADLCKKANDSARECMDYAISKLEQK
jgi:hypothetical protein